MRMVILYAMAVAALIVVILGGLLAITVLVDLLWRMWVKKAKFARNMINYITNRPDYEVYKAAVANPVVVPMKHGHWTKEKCQGDYGRCSECNCRIPWIPKNYQYCPSCGTKNEVISCETI